MAICKEQSLLDPPKIHSTEWDTELYAANINITGVQFTDSKVYLSFEFLVIYKDASRWVRDIIEVDRRPALFLFQEGFREALVKYVEEQRAKLRQRSAKLSVSCER